VKIDLEIVTPDSKIVDSMQVISQVRLLLQSVYILTMNTVEEDIKKIGQINKLKHDPKLLTELNAKLKTVQNRFNVMPPIDAVISNLNIEYKEEKDAVTAIMNIEIKTNNGTTLKYQQNL